MRECRVKENAHYIYLAIITKTPLCFQAEHVAYSQRFDTSIFSRVKAKIRPSAGRSIAIGGRRSLSISVTRAKPRTMMQFAWHHGTPGTDEPGCGVLEPSPQPKQTIPAKMAPSYTLAQLQMTSIVTYTHDARVSSDMTRHA